MKRHTPLVLFQLVIAFCCFNTLSVYAGSINENESAIIGVITGQFESGGVTYRVKSEYINAAKDYFRSDGVDVTADQRDKAIAAIYANVATGVESGYLEPIQGQTEPDTEKETIPTESVMTTEAENISVEAEENHEINESEIQAEVQALQEEPMTSVEMYTHPIIAKLEAAAYEEIEPSEIAEETEMELWFDAGALSGALWVIVALWAAFFIAMFFIVRFRLFHHHKRNRKGRMVNEK